jgi:alpha-mannosidase
MKGIGFVFSHAHWDIEWYMPFRAYRFWLVDLLDGLRAISLENLDFRTFVLDGQVAPLEHYLAVRPEAGQAMCALVSAGTLAIGPFYTQFDEWLASPESIVRNCLYGRRRAMELGGRWMRAGYLPDNFGHPAQLPQILAGFGIDSLIFMRGMPDRPAGFGDEFLLQGLDGTRVIAIHLSDTYVNAVGIGSSPRLSRSVYQQGPYGDWMFGYGFLRERAAVTDVQSGAEKLVTLAREGADRHPSGVIPLANGHDHAPPQARIGEVIARANGMQDEFQFVQGTCEDLVDRVRPTSARLPVYKGELWGARYQVLLTGTLSTRTYIKQHNFASEALLEKYADPLAAYAEL